MENRNSVSVKIYGQDYSISGDISKEKIIKIASIVDEEMHKVAMSYKGPVSSVAVLAAMNIASDIDEAIAKDRQLENISEKLAQSTSYNEVLRARIDELTTQLENTKSVPEESQKLIHELEAKCRDIESSFFDIQMENFHLKNELETLRRQANKD